MAHDDTELLVVLTTVPVDFDVDALARTLIAERLAACVSVFPPMISTYRWQGRTETASERQVVLKTTGHRIEALRVRLHALHPYEVPEFLMMAAEGSASYVAWLRQETRES